MIRFRIQPACLLHLLGLCLILKALPLSAQELQTDTLGRQEITPRVTCHALAFGIGAANVLESYLSPLEYTGIEARIQRETFRRTTLMQSHIYVQTLLNMHASYTKNTSGQEMYEGLLNWNIGWLYDWQICPNLRLLAGPMGDVNLGVVYNDRNSNNPAQAKVYINIDASAMLLYNFRLFHREIGLKYQLAVPLGGLMFSPEYGQSYYEIFELGHHRNNICFTSLHNQPSLRQYLMLDFPVCNQTIRIGYIADIQQSKVNQIKAHTYSHAFMVGFIKNFRLIKPKDNVKTPFSTSGL